MLSLLIGEVGKRKSYILVHLIVNNNAFQSQGVSKSQDACGTYDDNIVNSFAIGTCQGDHCSICICKN